jgi:FkbM family methyltransferase
VRVRADAPTQALRSLRWHAPRAVRQVRALTPSSFVRYARWRGTGRPGDIRVRLRDGMTAIVRGRGPDYCTLSEIYFQRQYDPPVTLGGEPRTIVDVGANVGYSCLWFLARYPRARITAFEPLPAHVVQLRAQLELNHAGERVTVVAAAAGTRAGSARFVEDGPGSHLADDAAPGAIEVPVVDWFDHLPEGSIDLVKLDIEGAECDLLADERFPAVAARSRAVVVEWHTPRAGRGGRDWCADRLAAAGLVVRDGERYDHAGMLWGLR